jgi:hypothetical protein
MVACGVGVRNGARERAICLSTGGTAALLAHTSSRPCSQSIKGSCQPGKMKIIDKVNEKLKKGETFFSFEFFPPRTEEVRTGATLVALGRWRRRSRPRSSPD